MEYLQLCIDYIRLRTTFDVWFQHIQDANSYTAHLGFIRGPFEFGGFKLYMVVSLGYTIKSAMNK